MPELGLCHLGRQVVHLQRILALEDLLERTDMAQDAVPVALLADAVEPRVCLDALAMDATGLCWEPPCRTVAGS